MAISTYSELQSAVASWLARDGDTTITAMLPGAISLVEAKLNRHLRVSQMEASAVGTSSNGVLALPSDFLEARRVEAYPYGPLDQVEPGWAASAYPLGESGIPGYYTIQGSNLTTFPAYTGEVALDYYQAIPALSDSNPSNWLLTSYPDVYLFLTLSEANAFTKDPDAALLWNQRGMQAVEEMKAQDQKRRYSNVSIRVKGPTP